MSWDVMAFKLEAEVRSLDALDDSKMRSMGSTGETRANISACLPGVDWSDPTWGIYDGNGFSFEFNVGADQPEMNNFMVHVRGGGDAVSDLLKFSVPNGWSLFDCSTSEFIDPKSPSSEGWKEFQAFRDKVVETAARNQQLGKKPWWKFW